MLVRSGRTILAGLILLTGGQAGATEAKAGQGTLQERAVRSADGVTIRYATFGEGEPALVLVHCWSCDRHLWDDVVPYLAKDRRVVTLDLAGHGESGRDRKEWTMTAFGEDVRAVVDALALRKVILAGHSMGGPVILEAARLLPDKVVGLIPVDTGLDVERTSSAEEIAGIIGAFESDYRGTAERFTRQYMFNPKSDQGLIERVVAKNVSAPPEVAIPCLRAVFSYDARPVLREVRLRAHAVNADLRPTNVEANRRHFASYDVTLMTGVGHYLMLEDARRFSELLVDAASKLSGRGVAPPTAADNAEMSRIFAEDVADRAPGLHGIDWAVVKPRDDARLKRTRELYEAGELRTGADWFHAALVFQHSNDPDDYLLAHEMCVAALAEGEKKARWLVAAAEDRFLMAIGRKQRFGTQYELAEEPGKFRLAPTDPRVTDELRAAVGAPPLAEAKATEGRFDKKEEASASEE